MILVVCLNPALDVTYHVDSLVPGRSHRVRSQHERAGGKGVNVARVLHQLGEHVILTGLLGGTEGGVLRSELDAAGVWSCWTAIADATRRTVTVLAQEATVLREPGPVVTDAEWGAFLRSYTGLARRATAVVLSGSLPRGVPDDAYARLAALSPCAVLDAEGTALRAGLDAHPYLAKPNAAEARGLAAAGDPLDALLAAGAANAVVSDGEAGLVAAVDGRRYRVVGPAVPGNATGAGDALTAVLARGIAAGTEWPALLREAAAVAGGAVAVPHAGAFDAGVADRLRADIVVEEC
jgi:1-phosphofructokinase family hexose kinase